LKVGGAVGLLKDDMLKIGGAFKYVSRRGANDTASTETLLSLSNDELVNWVDRRGHAVGFDLGASLSIPTGVKTVEPIVALVWQDIFTTTFVGNGVGSKTPGLISDNLTMSLGTIIDLPAMDIKAAIDVKHLTDRGIAIPLKVHTGVEVQMPMLKVSAGLNQGYYTAGVAFDMFFFTIELSTYGEELGSYPGQKEDRRYTLKAYSSLSLFN
jgi:hypothetical protein